MMVAEYKPHTHRCHWDMALCCMIAFAVAVHGKNLLQHVGWAGCRYVVPPAHRRCRTESMDPKPPMGPSHPQ